ncbi:hypothetical protein BDK92_2810 [Micromonospora pisi]|uniref:Uncharacterized protein n=1 Tax=Micromonospora pisi TaxID=589240 RepID=A0A495JJI4_9ACTN|nr:hypothetical protein [Micromonospora pisi]RKR88482.1 hypothetical protein BDK92_2810 [Micromonospora pisi]
MPAEPRPPRWAGLVRLLDLLLRIAGGVLAVIAALVTGTLELLLATLRVGGQLIGVSVLVAIAANLVLGWFAYRTVGRRWAVALPAVPWFALMAVAAIKTSEGDVLLAGDNWVGVVMIFAGSMAFAALAFKLIVSRPLGPLPPSSRPAG